MARCEAIVRTTLRKAKYVREPDGVRLIPGDYRFGRCPNEAMVPTLCHKHAPIFMPLSGLWDVAHGIVDFIAWAQRG